MTELGKLLDRKSANKAEISRKTNISTTRLSDLSLKRTTRLTAEELYLIAMAIDIDPGIILKQICGHLTLNNNENYSQNVKM